MLRCEISTAIDVAVRGFSRGFARDQFFRCEISTAINFAVRDFQRDQFSGARFQR
jgi:hypothetical protein